MNTDMPNKFVIAHSRLRLVSHSLAVEIAWHHESPYEARLCSLCCHLLNEICVECEFHFLLDCACYGELRERYLRVVKTVYNFVKIMKSEDVIEALFKFPYYALKLRKNKMNGPKWSNLKFLLFECVPLCEGEVWDGTVVPCYEYCVFLICSVRPRPF